MRTAVKVAYDGHGFHGSQRQRPEDGPTVQGSVIEALVSIGAIEAGIDPPVAFSSRTDAGVSALGNVFSVDTEMDPQDMLCALNANLEGIWCLAHARMRDSQNVRWANSRWYRYHLDADMSKSVRAGDLNGILMEYVGEHDFRHFCRPGDGRDTSTRIESARAVDLSGDGSLLAVDFVGTSFLWNQVRRMVGAAISVQKGIIGREQMSSLLHGGDIDEGLRSARDRIPTYPATGLVLMDVSFKDLEFFPCRRAIEIAMQRSAEGLWRSTVAVILGSALLSIRDSMASMDPPPNE
ncbi:MAG: hypothetical protein QCI82_02215 [Candidatus Thermoplasmatota archaeon]|nr:hypothetical protein [Candidatus Thermoplasmatota archaeon]